MSASTGPVSGSLERLRQEIDRVVESAWSQGERAADFIGLRRSSCPAVDVIEQADRVNVSIDLPSVSPEAVELTLVGNMLTVQGTYPPAQADGAQTHLSERPKGTFKRSIPLPASVNPDDIRAETRHGVLHVSIGKTESTRPRKISISAGQSGGPIG